MKNHRVDAKALIYYLSPKEGGNKGPLLDGYGCQINFYDPFDWSTKQYFEEGIIDTGKLELVELSFNFPEAFYGRLYVEKEFILKEGSRIKGRGEISDIINSRLRLFILKDFVEKKRALGHWKPASEITINSFAEQVISYISKTNLQLTDIQVFIHEKQAVQICIHAIKLDHTKHVSFSDINHFWRPLSGGSLDHYRIENHKDNFELTFAIWQNGYITGKVIIHSQHAQ